jgi:catechol 2,3-dioxygenase-like lactoylglutathione lyase family enzyme
MAPIANINSLTPGTCRVDPHCSPYDCRVRFRHVALLISDVRAAEDYYRAIFGMSVLFREAVMQPGGPDAGAWATLPPGSGWEEAEAAGVTIGMAALQRDDVVLALLAAEPTGAQIYTIGFTMSNEEMEGLRSRLPVETVIEGEAEGWLAFVDRFGMRWQVSNSAGFSSTGESLDRWLDLT